MFEELISFDEAVNQFVIEDPRYPPEAYYFVRDGFEFAARLRGDIVGSEDSVGRHQTGAELSEGLCKFAGKEYGPMALYTLSKWGIFSTSDFGNIVYNLIAMKKFSQSEGDKREDFDNLFPIEDMLGKPFEA